MRQPPDFDEHGLRLDPQSFLWQPSAEALKWALLKRRLKHAPKMTKKQRAEYLKRLLDQILD
jgi:hypothetical protein